MNLIVRTDGQAWQRALSWKPRLFRMNGLWWCSSRHDAGFTSWERHASAGTWQDAYRQWKWKV